MRCCCHPAMLPGPRGRMRRSSTGVSCLSYRGGLCKAGHRGPYRSRGNGGRLPCVP
ncbi:hypothetical protein SGL43_05847 [Streptomyces globisporus]|uniref:Uncharacterized protein n=1 Tax=Streptomyces globisporus TaxID=1908 RepID=A0ABM9H581_STRGL|nr:hypothetical protein SGL43_05847 [Streptomyces globisporus]